MELVLSLRPSAFTFSAPGSAGPYPWLANVGRLEMAVRSGYTRTIASGASPTLQVSIDNAERKAALLIGRPLRARAIVYADDGSVFFGGIVAALKYRRFIEMTIQS